MLWPLAVVTVRRLAMMGSGMDVPLDVWAGCRMRTVVFRRWAALI